MWKTAAPPMESGYSRPDGKAAGFPTARKHRLPQLRKHDRLRTFPQRLLRRISFLSCPILIERKKREQKKKREFHPRLKPKASLPLHYLIGACCFIWIFLLRLWCCLFRVDTDWLSGTLIWFVNRLISGNFPSSMLQAACICPFNERICLASSSEQVSTPISGFTVWNASYMVFWSPLGTARECSGVTTVPVIGL